MGNDKDIESAVNEIFKRLQFFRKRILGISSYRSFADDLGISAAAMGNYESDRTDIPARVLLKMFEVFGLNIHWLVTGEGKTLAPKPNTESRVVLSVTGKITPEEQEWLNNPDADMTSFDLYKSEKETTRAMQAHIDTLQSKVDDLNQIIELQKRLLDQK